MKRLVLLVVLASVLVLIVIVLVGIFLSNLVVGPYSSEMVLYNNFSRAVAAPNTIIVSQNLRIPQGSVYTTRIFAETSTVIDENCVELQTNDPTTVNIHESKLLQTNKAITTNIYYKCVSGETIGKKACPLFCTISFGKELT